jgi:hypothetical protein
MLNEGLVVDGEIVESSTGETEARRTASTQYVTRHSRGCRIHTAVEST